MGLSSRASIISMFSSPGMPKMYSTPSFSRHFTNSCAAVIATLGHLGGHLETAEILSRIQQTLGYSFAPGVGLRRYSPRITERDDSLGKLCTPLEALR